MSVSCGFYNSLNGDRKYDAIQMSQIFDGIVNDGVYMSIGDHLNVTPNAGMTVSVGTGRAWFNHTWTLNDAILPLTLDDAEVIVNRIDAIVLEVNAERETRNNEIKIVKGTPATVPEKPTLVNTDDVHQYPLAYITVDHDVTEITASMIENAVGTSATPFVTGIIETINIDTLVAQWGAQWTEWFAQQKSTMEEWTEEQQTEFEEWVETIRYIFDDTTAGRLMNYIDAVKTAALDYNKFELSASSWVANIDSYALSYPYCYHVRTNKYTADAHPTWALNGPGDTMPTITHYKNAIKYIYEAEFDSTGITLYAVKQPTENLCLCVKGGKFIYDVTPSNHIPNSDPSKIICDADIDNFNPNSLNWGSGSNPITFTSNVSLNQQDNAVAINVLTDDVRAFVDLEQRDTPYTAYIVAKLPNPRNYARIMACMDNWTNEQGLIMFCLNNEVMIGSWNNDDTTGIGIGNYFVGVLKYDPINSSKGKVNDSAFITKTPQHSGQYITIGRSGIQATEHNAENTDVLVKYFGVVGEAESLTTIEENVLALMTEFGIN